MSILSSSKVTEKLVLWINRALEILWLLTVVVVPLAFLPRDYVFSESELSLVSSPLELELDSPNFLGFL